MARQIKKKGDWVRIRSAVMGLPAKYRLGVLTHDYRGARGVHMVLTHGGTAHCTGLEMAVMRDEPDLSEFPMRWSLPYGLWRGRDGREILFNRDYRPIYERSGSTAQQADQAAWIKDIADQRWFYNAGSEPWQDGGSHTRCLEVLANWGVPPRATLGAEDALATMRRHSF